VCHCFLSYHCRPFRIEDIPNILSNLLPGNPLASMVTGEMRSIVVFTIIIGIALVSLPKETSNPVMHLLGSVMAICMIVVKWAMLMVPVAVFGLMARIVATIGLSSIWGIGRYAVVVLLGLLVLLVLYLLLVSLIGKRNPFRFLAAIREVPLLAFSTTSSAAPLATGEAQASP